LGVALRGLVFVFARGMYGSPPPSAERWLGILGAASLEAAPGLPVDGRCGFVGDVLTKQINYRNMGKWQFDLTALAWRETPATD